MARPLENALSITSWAYVNKVLDVYSPLVQPTARAGVDDYASPPARNSRCQPLLVAPKAGEISVLKSFTEVPLIDRTIAFTRVVVLSRTTIGAEAVYIMSPVSPEVIATFLEALIESRVQRGLTQLKRTTVVAITIVVASAARSVVAISPILAATISRILRVLRLRARAQRDADAN